MKRHAALNRIYRLVWSELHQGWIAVSEITRGKKKQAGSSALAFILVLLSPSLLAAPTGGQITGGSGSISQAGNTTTIRQDSSRLSIGWTSFNTTSQETVNFVQPSANAIAVNRISDPNPTQFLGHLNANGQVWLINPNGVLFGQGAQINVGGLVASTLDVKDSALNTLSRNFSGGGNGSIINQGTINTLNRGYVALIGKTVSNQGNINTPNGSTQLLAGQDITLTFADNSLVGMQINQNVLNALVENKGAIYADGGLVLLSASARNAVLASVVNNSGLIEAHSVSEKNGTILLDGGNKGSVDNSGTLDASGKGTGQTGGTVKVLGETVSLASGSTIDASGDTGGGTVLIGGNFHGSGPEQNATTTSVDNGAVIHSDALTQGNGGMWPSGLTVKPLSTAVSPPGAELKAGTAAKWKPPDIN